MVLTPGSKIL